VTARASRRNPRARLERGAQDHYADPAFYTRAYRSRRRDIEFYVERAIRSGGPVLEYGVGNGRVALPIARAGIAIVGLDASVPMLADLERRARHLPAAARARISWVRADMRSARLDARFQLVIAPFNTILHLYERRDLERFLDGVRTHLAPGAPFVFDYSVPIAGDLGTDSDCWRSAGTVRAPGTSERARYRERFDYDPLRQVLTVEMEFEPVSGAPASRTVLTHRQYFPREMEALLRHNGFANHRFTADFTKETPDSSVDSLVIEAHATGRLASAPRRT
jgi:SAM-dependent methyltransferase